MKHHWLHQKGNKNLIVFLNGWGMNTSAVSHLECGTFDVLEVDSYHTQDELPWEGINAYGRKTLIGWSMGVWFASFNHLWDRIKFDRSIALAGTPQGMDDTMGISKKMMELTLHGISEANFDKFLFRTTGGGAFYEQIKANSQRSLEDRAEELRFWIENNSQSVNSRWGVALVPAHDKILPTQNQKNAWRTLETLIVEINSAHFVPGCFSNWEAILMSGQTNKPV